MRRETDYFGIIRIFKGKNAAITKQRSARCHKKSCSEFSGFGILRDEERINLIYL